MLDPQVAEFVNNSANQLAPTDVSVEESRKLLAGAVPPLNIPIKRREDLKVPGPGGDIPVRIYIPSEAENIPVIVYYHGGGWSRGDLETAENMCAILANKTGFSVVSVGYRLAPEHPYPAGVNDSYEALKWVGENASNYGWDADRLAVAGDSAGGTMAAVVSQKAKNEKGPRVAHQVMICPATNLLELNTSSYEDFGEGYVLSRGWVEHYRDLYVPDKAAWSEPYVSPMLEKDLSGLPGATIITAECDVLRDEAEDYAARLREAGVPVTLIRYPGTIHDFVLLLPEIEISKKAFDDISSALKERLE